MDRLAEIDELLHDITAEARVQKWSVDETMSWRSELEYEKQDLYDAQRREQEWIQSFGKEQRNFKSESM